MHNKIAKVFIFFGIITTALIELMNSLLFSAVSGLSKEITKTDINSYLSLIGLGLVGLMFYAVFVLKTKTSLAIKILFTASIASLVIYRGWIIGPILVLIGTIIYYRNFKKV